MRKQQIIDTVLFFNELELLELRLEGLYDIVDKFVIVESTKTFTGKPKSLFFKENIQRFDKWSDKIHHYIVDDMPDELSQEEINKLITIPGIQTMDWIRENHQKLCIGNALKDLKLEFNDIILVSDVDEFPNLNDIDDFNKNLPFGPIIFKQKWLVWNTSLEKMHHWMGTTAFYYSDYLRNKKIFQIFRDKRWDENSPEFYTKENGGFHFSWFGDFDFIRNKVYSFAHTEIATDFWMDDQNIISLINDGYASNGMDRDGITGKLQSANFEGYDKPKVWGKLTTFGIKKDNPMIYDCFLFDHELDMLNLRLHEMGEYVDSFILVESRQSHSGKDKELYFYKNRNLFKDFLDKIEHVIIDLPNEVYYEPHAEPTNEIERLNWFRENYHRNSIKDVLEKLNINDDDIVLISDIDEVWDDDILRRLKNNEVEFDTFKTILQRWMYWNFRWDFEDMRWPGAAFCKWSYLKTTTPQKIRNVRYEQETHLDDVNGWHLSWFGDVEFNLHKLRNFAHQELSNTTREELERMINEGYLFDGEKMIELQWDYFPKNRKLLEEGKLYRNIYS